MSSVADLMRYYAEVEPQELDRLEVDLREQVDDLSWSEPTLWLKREARRRLLQRIGEARANAS